MYDENVMVPVTPTVTQWTAHEHACRSVIKGYHQLISSLRTCYNGRWESDALGLLVQLCKPIVVAVIFMSLEVFECTGPLGLLLQKVNGAFCLAYIPTYIKPTKSKLILRKEECNFFLLRKKFYPGLFQRGYIVQISLIRNHSWMQHSTHLLMPSLKE